MSANARTELSVWSWAWLTLRGVVWTLLLPGIVAGYVPWRFLGLNRSRVDWFSPFDLAGLVCVGLGVMLLLACIVEFVRRGRGTLSPADPPRHLVVSGLYRHVRNPMYLGVTAIILGEAMLSSAPALASYLAIWFFGANLFVLGYEEPELRRRFGESYDEYTRNVGRWLPRSGWFKRSS